MAELTTQQIVDQTKQYTLFTWACQSRVHPMVVDSAKGVYYWDSAGKRYLDLNSLLVNVNIGHGNEKMIRAIQEQTAKLAYASPGHATLARAKAGRMLSEIVPMKQAKVLFTLSGAESNEYAIRLARHYTGRQKILARYRSYHGGTALAISLTGEPRRWHGEPSAPGVVHVLDPYCYRCPFGQEVETCHMECAEHLEEVINYEGPQTIAAVIMEPVTGSTGLIIPPRDYLQRVRAICDKYNILFIADEVMSGFGRTGRWFAVDNWGVVPDMISMSKGITCAYVPFGAVAVSGEIASYCDDHLVPCGQTANAHPVGCAATVAAIEIYREEKLVERACEMGKVLGRELQVLKAKHPSVGDLRHIGMFSTMELVKDPVTREPLVPFKPMAELAGPMSEIGKYLIENGVMTLLRWHYLFVNPPLIITEAELHEGLAVIDKALDIADQAVAT